IYGEYAADRSYDRLLSGSALSIAETLTITEGEIRVDLPYAALDMLSAAPDDRVFYRVIGPDGDTVTGYDDLPVEHAVAAPVDPSVPLLPHFFDAQYRGELVRFA